MELPSGGVNLRHTTVPVPWKIEHLMTVPGAEEKLFSLSFLKTELDCYTFTLIMNKGVPSVAVLSHHVFKIPYCKYTKEHGFGDNEIGKEKVFVFEWRIFNKFTSRIGIN